MSWRPDSRWRTELARQRVWEGQAPSLEAWAGFGYAFGMKTAVSIPDEVFARVERLARRTGKSRSEVFSDALREYVARHAPDEVTEAMDHVCEQVQTEGNQFVREAARRVLERTEW